MTIRINRYSLPKIRLNLAELPQLTIIVNMLQSLCGYTTRINMKDLEEMMSSYDIGDDEETMAEAQDYIDKLEEIRGDINA